MSTISRKGINERTEELQPQNANAQKNNETVTFLITCHDTKLVFWATGP